MYLFEADIHVSIGQGAHRGQRVSSLRLRKRPLCALCGPAPWIAHKSHTGRGCDIDSTGRTVHSSIRATDNRSASVAAFNDTPLSPMIHDPGVLPLQLSYCTRKEVGQPAESEDRSSVVHKTGGLGRHAVDLR